MDSGSVYFYFLWVLLFCMFLRVIDVVARTSTFALFYCCVVFHSVFLSSVYPSYWRYLIRYQFLAIMNQFAVNILAYYFWWTCVLISLGSTVVCHLTMRMWSRNASLGDLVILTWQNITTQTYMVYPTAYLGYMLDPIVTNCHMCWPKCH